MAAGSWRRLLGLCGVIGLAALSSAMSGCGGSEVNVAVEPERPPVNPRYATADALVEHCRQLNELGLAAYRELPSLLYAETDVQQRIVNLIASATAFFDFIIALDEHFNLPLTDEQRASTRFLGQGNLQIVQRLDRRVIAEMRGKSSSRTQIHFLEYDGRWWLSGYTFEYDPNFKEFFEDPRHLEMSEMLMPALNAPAAAVAARMRTGEFKNPGQALAAFFTAVEQQVARTPALQYDFERYMRENRDLFPFMPKGR